MTAPNEARMVPYVDDNGTLRVGLKSTFDPDVAPGVAGLSATVVITSEQIAALGATPIEVVPAPADDKGIVISRWTFRSTLPDSGGSFRAGESTLVLKYDDSVEASGKNCASIVFAFISGISTPEWWSGVPGAIDAQFLGIALNSIRSLQIGAIPGRALLLTKTAPEDELIPCGTIATVTPVTGGSGYAPADTITLEAPDNSVGLPALLEVATVDGGGAVTGVTVLDGGDGYQTSGPTITTSGTSGGGTGASFSIDSILGPTGGLYTMTVEYALIDVEPL